MPTTPIRPHPAVATGPARLLSVYRGLVGAELQVASAYRAQLVIGAFGWVVPVAFLALWRGAAGGSDVGGITAAQFSTYFCVVLLTTSLQFSNDLAFSVEPLVHSGQLSALLLRPHHPMHVLIAWGVADKAYRVTPLLVIAPVLAVLLDGAVVAEASQWSLAVVVGLLGLGCEAYLGAMMGSVALWLTRSGGLRGLLFGAEWVFGGLVAPIVLLPWGLPELLRHQPMWFAIGAPGEAIAGISRLTPWVALEAAGWLLVLHWLFGVVWRRGMLQYEAVGT